MPCATRSQSFIPRNNIRHDISLSRRSRRLKRLRNSLAPLRLDATLMDLSNLASHAAQRLARSVNVEFAALRSFFEVLFPFWVHGYVC